MFLDRVAASLLQHGEGLDVLAFAHVHLLELLFWLLHCLGVLRLRLLHFELLNVEDCHLR